MRIKLKLRLKVLMGILFVGGLIFANAFISLSAKLKSLTINSAERYLDATTQEEANYIRGELDQVLGLCRALAQSFDVYDMNEDRQWVVPATLQVTEGIARNNPNIISTWVSWELWAIDNTWDKPYGRLRIAHFWDKNELKIMRERLNLDGDEPGSFYEQIKNDRRECLTEPYWMQYANSNIRVYESSLCVPVVHNDKMAALFGFDFDLEPYQSTISNIKPYQNSYAMMISQKGTILAHNNRKCLGHQVDSLMMLDTAQFNLLDSINKGKTFALTFADSLGNEWYASFAAINLGKTNNPWSLAIVTPVSQMLEASKATIRREQTLLIIYLMFLIIVGDLLLFRITHPLTKVKKMVDQLAQGQIDINNQLRLRTGDEIEDISNSMNSLIEGLDKMTKFAKEIGHGNFTATFEKLSDNDDLGESLLEMRKSLQHSKELEQQRKEVEEKEHWASEGVAIFAEILRNNADNMEEFAYSIISNIVSYVGADIGGLYLLNNDKKDEIFFELKGCYAYQNRKFEHKRIELREGLVGRCAQEGEVILLTDLPHDYIKIASGLGEDNPNCLLLVPMKQNDQVFGVIELAAFDILPDYKVKFVEKIGESIAVTISNVKTNLRTAQLLEDSRIKSEELSTQEEEMRQNLEELQATQEEAARKTTEMESLINALNTSSYVVEYDTNGRVLSANQAFLLLTRTTERDIVGTHHADNIKFTDEQKKNYQRFWTDLQNGIIKKEKNVLIIDNEEYTMLETYSPIFDENRKVYKILKIAHQVTEFVEDTDSKKNKKKKE